MKKAVRGDIKNATSKGRQPLWYGSGELPSNWEVKPVATYIIDTFRDNLSDLDELY